MSDKIGAAQAMLAIPLFHDILRGLEQTALDGCVNAAYGDHEKRQAFAADARAIRKFREEVEALAKAGQPTPARRAPA